MAQLGRQRGYSAVIATIDGDVSGEISDHTSGKCLECGPAMPKTIISRSNTAACSGVTRAMRWASYCQTATLTSWPLCDGRVDCRRLFSRSVILERSSTNFENFVGMGQAADGKALASQGAGKPLTSICRVCCACARRLPAAPAGDFADCFVMVLLLLPQARLGIGYGSEQRLCSASVMTLSQALNG